MKLIEPNVELIKQESGIEGIYKQIERAGRICYKSEDKITDIVKIDLSKIPDGVNMDNLPNYKEDKERCLKFLKENNIPYSFISSAESFANMLRDRGHNAMLEHGTVYLKVELPKDEITPGESLYHYKHNPYSTYNIFEGVAYITTNYRVLVENGWIDDLQYLCEPTQYHIKRYTLKFTTSIGITRELIRHRHFSFANESTRYCNYSKDKFGDEITFIKPYWYVDTNYTDDSFAHHLLLCENAYKFLIKHKNLQPQQAREVLPLATKSEIIMTGFESDWDAFFKLRCDKAAHPDMQYLANKAKEIIDNEKKIETNK